MPGTLKNVLRFQTVLLLGLVLSTALVLLSIYAAPYLAPSTLLLPPSKSPLGWLQLGQTLPYWSLMGLSALILAAHVVLAQQLIRQDTQRKSANLSKTVGHQHSNKVLQKTCLLLGTAYLVLLSLHYANAPIPLALLGFWVAPSLLSYLGGQSSLAKPFFWVAFVAWGTLSALNPLALSQLSPLPVSFGPALASGGTAGFPAYALNPGLMLLSLLQFALPLACLAYFGHLVAHVVNRQRGEVEELKSLASIDALTGLQNRRQFNQRLSTEIARAHRHRSTLSLALFDIDNFKRLNDFYGHPTGDRILKELGQLILSNIRESDIAARYGGEEFALILPETRQIEAYELLERLRAMVERTVFCLPDNPLTLTISIGVTQLDLDRHTTFDFIQEADQALYEAKRNGKNRIVLHGLGQWQPQAIFQE